MRSFSAFPFAGRGSRLPVPRDEVYGAVREILPAVRFAAVKKQQLAWLKQLEACGSDAQKCDLIAARVKELRQMVW